MEQFTTTQAASAYKGNARPLQAPQSKREQDLEDFMVQRDLIGEVLNILPELGKEVHSRVPVNEAFLPENLGVAQVKTIIYLMLHGEQTMSELARGLEVTLPGAADQVERLSNHGLVERVRDRGDKRVVRVRLTPAAKELASLVIDRRRHQVRSVLSQLEQRDRELFVKTLGMLTQALQTGAA